MANAGKPVIPFLVYLAKQLEALRRHVSPIAPIFQQTRGYYGIKHRSQKKLRKLARRRGC